MDALELCTPEPDVPELYTLKLGVPVSRTLKLDAPELRTLKPGSPELGTSNLDAPGLDTRSGRAFGDRAQSHAGLIVALHGAVPDVRKLRRTYDGRTGTLRVARPDVKGAVRATTAFEWGYPKTAGMFGEGLRGSSRGLRDGLARSKADACVLGVGADTKQLDLVYSFCLEWSRVLSSGFL